ncbi:hypothetical protein B566_EDAN014677 [Ephemera danica]|nr:hypothetical protein B566_EDAN014677 [Ephemera danica]
MQSEARISELGNRRAAEAAALEISCCSLQTDLSPPEFRRWRRIHGLQRPLHPQQILGWFLLLLLGVGTFALLLPALNWTPRIVLQPTLGVLFTIHALSHIISLLLDPAEEELRKIPLRRYPVPEFDRMKHAHVIEDGRCHLCNIAVSGVRTKHCSACNKCVANFDHHCKWLNHCVGGRNYYPFLICVSSAGFAALAIAAISLIEITFFYSSPEYLELESYTNSTSVSSLILQDTIVFPLVVSIIALLAITTAILLLHLFAFHIYIALNGITTYEYIRNYRYYAENKPVVPSRNTSKTKTCVVANEKRKFWECLQEEEKIFATCNEINVTTESRCVPCRRYKSDRVAPEKAETTKHKKSSSIWSHLCCIHVENDGNCFTRKSGRVQPVIAPTISQANNSPRQTQLSANVGDYDVYTIDRAPL